MRIVRTKKVPDRSCKERWESKVQVSEHGYLVGYGRTPGKAKKDLMRLLGDRMKTELLVYLQD